MSEKEIEMAGEAQKQENFRFIRSCTSKFCDNIYVV